MKGKQFLYFWLGSILMAPLFALILKIFNGKTSNILSTLEATPVIILFSLILSLPAAILTLITNLILLSYRPQKKSNFLFIYFIAIALCFLTLQIIGGTLIDKLFIVFGSSISISFIIITYQAFANKKQPKFKQK